MKTAFSTLRFLLSVLLGMTLYSCGADPLFEDLTRLPPPDTPPEAVSLLEERMIRLSWDEGAQSGLSEVFRSLYPDGGEWFLAYRGTDTRFEDRGLEPGRCYYYRLNRLDRGDIYPANGVAWGVAADTRHDAAEPNNTGTDAFYLAGETFSANLHAVRDGQGNGSVDEDWYRITVRGGHTVSLLLDRLQNVAPDDLLVTVAGEQPLHPVSHIRVTNHSETAREILFSVRIDTARLFPDPHSPAFLFGQYRIRYVSEAAQP